MSLNQHNASPAHKGKSYKCPFCDNMFKTPSSIAMHIESGCHRINRHQVTAAAHNLGIIPQISIPRRIEGLSKQPQLVNWFANENSFNGYSYECYLCHSTFKTLDRLNQHLNSPTHDESEFRCPHCGSEFQLISGLVQHIESESCGIARFQHVAKHFESLTQSFTRLLKLWIGHCPSWWSHFHVLYAYIDCKPWSWVQQRFLYYTVVIKKCGLCQNMWMIISIVIVILKGNWKLWCNSSMVLLVKLSQVNVTIGSEVYLQLIDKILIKLCTFYRQFLGIQPIFY